MGEEIIEKKRKEGSTEVPLLMCFWIKLERTLIDHHPKQITTKETLEKMLGYHVFWS